jgi:TRAP-type C4-dicarboxylate transport system permease small subunit
MTVAELLIGRHVFVAGMSRRVLSLLYGASALLGALAVFAVLALMLLQVACRELGYIFRGADDLTAWFCAAAVFLPLAHTFRHGELVRMGLLIERFRGARRRAAELIALGIAVIFAAYGSWWALQITYQSWLIDDRAQGMLPAPMWIPQASMAIGLILFLVALLDDLAAVVLARAPSYDIAERRRAAGDAGGNI